MSFTSLMLAAQSASSGSGTSGQMKEFISDLTNTLGVDLFDEEIDAVVFQTNQFLCDSTFIGASGPFWWILQAAMALGALFSICVAGGMAYKMMVKNEPIDVLKICKVLGLSLLLCFWYPPSMTGIGGSGNSGCILDLLAYIPNCIGSYTHDLYEAEAVQVQGKIYGENGSKGLMDLLKEKDEAVRGTEADIAAATKRVFVESGGDASKVAELSNENIEEKVKADKDLQKAYDKVLFAGTVIGFDKFIMFLAMVIYKIGWWSTIFCQQIILGMLTIFGPFQIAFSVLPKWEGAWAKWLIRYLTVHFYGAMLYFVGFYILLLFDIVVSIQIENLTVITSNEESISSFVQNAFMTGGYLLVASVVALKCLNLVPDLAAWMVPEGDTAFSTRNFGEGIASSAKGSITSVLPKF